MNQHLEVLPKSLLAGAVAILLYLIFLSLLGFFGIASILLGFNLQVNADTLALATTILFTVIIAIQIYEVGKLDKADDERKKQIDLLIILSEELDFLKGNLTSYVKSLSKPNHYPLYELWRTDTSLYFANLSHKINNKNVLGLKKNLMKIKDKIILINNFKSELIKLEVDRANEEIVKQVRPGDAIRKGMVTLIEKEVLPVLKDSKKIINNVLNS